MLLQAARGIHHPYERDLAEEGITNSRVEMDNLNIRTNNNRNCYYISPERMSFAILHYPRTRRRKVILLLPNCTPHTLRAQSALEAKLCSYITVVHIGGGG